MLDPITASIVSTAAKAAWNSDFRKNLIKTNKEKEEEQAKRKVDQIYAVVKIVCVGLIIFLLHLWRLKRCKEKKATLAQLTIADAGSDD